MNKKWLWIAPLAIAGLALFIAIGGQVVMYLWNAILPDLFGLRTITFWQALGLLALCRILFGGFGGDTDTAERGASTAALPGAARS
jgi:hypothetical protein